MRLSLNGATIELADGTTVAALVAQRSDQKGSVAVAVNSEVVPRSTWASTRLAEADHVELLAAVAGG